MHVIVIYISVPRIFKQTIIKQAESVILHDLFLDYGAKIIKKRY